MDPIRWCSALEIANRNATETSPGQYRIRSGAICLRSYCHREEIRLSDSPVSKPGLSKTLNRRDAMEVQIQWWIVLRCAVSSSTTFPFQRQLYAHWLPSSWQHDPNAISLKASKQMHIHLDVSTSVGSPEENAKFIANEFNSRYRLTKPTQWSLRTKNFYINTDD